MRVEFAIQVIFIILMRQTCMWSLPFQPLRSSLRGAKSFTTVRQVLDDIDIQYLSVKRVYELVVDDLTVAQVPEAESSARYLISDAVDIGYKYSDFQNNQALLLNQGQVRKVNEYVKRRKAREPVQYIIGNWDFYGYRFLCESPILIPRPETEELVDMIVASGILRGIQSPHILDIGTGTGAIGISLLGALPTTRCTAIDINPHAISLATRNSKLILGVKSSERFSGVCKSFSDFAKMSKNLSQFDLIISNPPYIPRPEIQRLEPEVRDFEDKIALDGGDDGLEIVSEIVQHAPCLLRASGTRELWMEVDSSHPTKISTSFNESRGYVGTTYNMFSQYASVQEINDLSGRPRFIRMRIK